MSILFGFEQYIQWVRFVFGWVYVTAYTRRPFTRQTGLPTNLFKAAHPFLKMLGTGGPFWLAGAEVSSRPVPSARLLAMLADEASGPLLWLPAAACCRCYAAAVACCCLLLLPRCCCRSLLLAPAALLLLPAAAGCLMPGACRPLLRLVLP